ncbi:MAG: DNA polymerase ligase N-terminal domain-containing protein, partial [Lysobacterales bacterium]
MSLQEYRRKRAFDRTAEPDAEAAAQAGRALFVIQLHHARRRHYDLRLQVGDVLRSWAVPKGPSLDPAVKRLAVEVEDHPLAYADFQGEIAEGEYGAGHVALFDRGVWTSADDAEQQLAKGHLRFELYGRKLRGGWHLVRSGKPARQPQWLLFKDEDEFAGPVQADDLLDDVVAPSGSPARRRAKAAAKPTDRARAVGAGKDAKTASQGTAANARRVRRRSWRAAAAKLVGAQPGTVPDQAPSPQLASPVAQPPRGDDWLHELKWDGYRIMATLRAGQVRLWSRNGLEWTDRLPEIVQALGGLAVAAAVLDGE